MDGGAEREDPKMKQKKGDTAAVCTSKEAASSPPWPWQNMVENQELSVIIDLINIVSHIPQQRNQDEDLSMPSKSKSSTLILITFIFFPFLIIT